FEREKKGMWDPEPKPAAKGVVTIPILPIQTDPLIDIRGLDLLPGRVASVTGVRWDAGHLSPTAYRVSFQEYWDAIGGPRYNASRVFMLDLAGVNRANPNFEVTRHLVKRCDVWLESGGREPEEVMDGYMLDVERVVAGSKTLASLDAFSVLYALSSEVLRLGERGFAGGLVDPFTPVIRDLLKPPKPETKTAAGAPAPTPRASPSPRSVPDPG